MGLKKLEAVIGHTFKKSELLEQALVHRSYLNEHPGFHLGHNERLEFLGDAVLELVVTEQLYKRYPESTEGELTSLRASLVNSKALAELAQEINLNDHLYLSKGEAKDAKDSKARQIILANAIESTIGALYLDGGMTASRAFIKKFIVSKLDYILEHNLHIDPKSSLQELVQEKIGVTPSYKVLSEEGPDHSKLFTVGVYFGSKLVAKGTGTSKQLAQESAAKNALQTKI